ncbi:hypothetical protein Q3G72_030482 [Acer saccharum]|nr:hypothetical protein Q3G72_030482 [Acer saccharum]
MEMLLESPLLKKEDDKSSKDSGYSFSNAGVWSKLTFGWLNPLFAKGRVEKLGLNDIPSIPHSETAENASLLLEESVQKQNMVTLSLKQVVAYSIWRPLAINAVFAEFIREEDQKKPIPDHASMSSDISVDIEVGDYAWETSDQKSHNSTIKITERMKIMKGYKKCLMGLLSEMTVFYATHQLEFLGAADLVLVMKDGEIVQSGKFEDLIANLKSQLVKQMTAHMQSLDQVKAPQEDNSLPRVSSEIQQIDVTEEDFSRPISPVEFTERIHEEEAETGRGLQMSSNYWIAWATEEKHNVSSVQLIGVFVLLSGGSSAFILGRAVLLSTIAIKTAQRAATICCFNQEDRFLRRSLRVINDYSRIAFHNYGTMEWLSVRTNFLFNIVFFLVLIILVTLPRSAIYPSLAGLVATYGLNLNVLQACVIWNLCNVENKMISVERILQFTKLPSESPLVIKESRPDSDWPTNGKIELENLQVQYTPALPMILKGITCIFPGEKKIGVFGRTATDNVIQQTIREETNRCTVITVAHRIPTVIDNDLVLVLDEGKIVEYDSPGKLLEDNTSSFSKLVTEFLRRSSKR